MLKNASVYALAFGALLSCSDETTEEPLNLNGEMRGKVYLVTEFGQLETSQEGASLSLEGSQSVQTSTDGDGNYLLDVVPTGTYNLIIEKNGFGTINNRGLRVIGGDEPLFGSYTLSRLSTTKVTDLRMEYSAYSVVVQGTVTHSHPSVQFPFVRLVVFMSNSSDVSPEKHLSSSTFYLLQPTGTNFSINLIPDSKIFPSGSTLYIAMYGLSNPSYAIYNPETMYYDYSSLGTVPSNVASITVP